MDCAGISTEWRQTISKRQTENSSILMQILAIPGKLTALRMYCSITVMSIVYLYVLYGLLNYVLCIIRLCYVDYVVLCQVIKVCKNCLRLNMYMFNYVWLCLCLIMFNYVYVWLFLIMFNMFYQVKSCLIMFMFVFMLILY